MTSAPITGLQATKVEYCPLDPLKPSVGGAFQRVQWEDTDKPEPDTSIPHHGRKTLAIARAAATIDIRLIFGTPV
jgi:hypothetical protein